MNLSRIPDDSPDHSYLAVELKIVRRVSTNTFHDIYKVIGEALTLDRLKKIQPYATYLSWNEFMSLPELPEDTYEFAPEIGVRPERGNRPDMQRGSFWIWRIADQVFEVEAFEINWTDCEVHIRSKHFSMWVPISALTEPSPLTRRIWL